MNCMVTGVSRGIGRATVTELVHAGHFVWGISRTAVPDLLEEEKTQFRHSICDIGNPENRQDVAKEMDAADFKPNIVILNAAVEYEEEKTALSWEKMQEVLRINVEGALFWISHWMDRAERYPMQFVGISSLMAFWPDVDCPAYSASKAALSMSFRGFRLRYSNESAAFKLLVLGPVQTSINPRFASSNSLPGYVSTPENVARYIVNAVLSKHRFTFYYPLGIGFLCRFNTWMPDKIFEYITRPFRR